MGTDDQLKVLDMLSTHPDHQYRGAGSMLVKWGTDIADAMGVKAYIEGTIVAKHLYESHGFVASEDWITVPVEEKWKEKPVIKYFSYEREAKKTSGE
jgi:GNAT superfamily N-acetyltransferase